MWNKFGLKVLAISIALVIVASSVAMYGHSGTDVEKGISEGGGKGVISLMPPPFIGVAGASEAMGGGGCAFPEDEAGILAYVDVSETIDIEKLKIIFTEVEEVGDNYIIGITPISDFGGNINVHVYADTDGWIVAYFEKDEPASKIMQWEPASPSYPSITEITTTTLRDAIYKAAIAADIPPATLPEINYYDFKFPDANGMTIFIRTKGSEGTNIAQVEIPATYTLYEASYYHYIYYYSDLYTPASPDIQTYWDSKLKVDGTTVSDAYTYYGGDGVYTWWRAFDSYKVYITTGTLHKIAISYVATSSYSSDLGSSGVATVLIYKTG